MKRYLYWVVGLLLLAGCSHSRTAEVPTLTVTIEPLRYFTEAIAGPRYRVVSMVPEGSSPETYDPTPQQLVHLAQSAAYLQVGYIGFEQSWIEKLKANNPGLPFFDTYRGIDLIREEVAHHGHTHAGGVEPHVWNSPKNVLRMADNICAALCRLDTLHADEYRTRTDSLQRMVRQTDAAIRALLPVKGRSFLIYHPALSYFARDYGWQQVSIEENGKEPSPAQLQALIRLCREKEIRVIFVQQEFDLRNARLIARELGVTVIPVNPLSYHWQEEMLNVARSLSTAP